MPCTYLFMAIYLCPPNKRPKVQMPGGDINTTIYKLLNYYIFSIFILDMSNSNMIIAVFFSDMILPP